MPGEAHRAIYLLLAGIMSPATPALARAKAAQANMSIRNPKTNAWEMELRKDTPAGRPTEIRSAREGQIQSLPRLGGLHHRYAVAA